MKRSFFPFRQKRIQNQSAKAGDGAQTSRRPSETKTAPVYQSAGAWSIRTAPSSAGATGFQEAWSALQLDQRVKAGFLRNPIAFRSVRLIAEAAAHVDLHLQDPEIRYDTHPVLKRLKAPNPSQAGHAFFEALYGQYLLFGQVFIQAVYDENHPPKTADEAIASTLPEAPNAPSALYLLRPDRVEIALSREGWPRGYVYKVQNQKTFFPIEGEQSSILHIKSFHPLDDHQGLSPLLAAADAIDVHNAAGDWSKALLQNAARPSGAIVYKGAEGAGHLGEAQFQRLVDELQSFHQGARNAGRPMLLEGGLDWKPMGLSPNDMEFHRTKEMAAREIALALGVPPMLLGIPGDNTYANYQEANRAFYRLTVLPLVGHILSALNDFLLKESDANLQIDRESIMALASERDAYWRRIADADFLSESEKRVHLGFPAHPPEDAPQAAPSPEVQDEEELGDE